VLGSYEELKRNPANVRFEEACKTAGLFGFRFRGGIRNILGHLGLADVREFGLSWDDCYDYLSQLGYQVKVTIY